MFLEEIIDNVQLENDKFECKGILNREDVIGWLKTIAGFANASGGDFYIGVEDKTNKLIGFVKPIILKYKNIPSIFMRRDGFTNGATYEEIIEMSIQSKNIQYDILTSDTIYDPAQFTTLQSFYKNHNDGHELKEKFLNSIGFYNEERFLSNGAVLFADNYSGEKTAVQCSVFSGFNKGSERIITINRFHGNIIATIQYMIDFVNQRMNHSMIKLDHVRQNIDSYPQRALFEGIINAVAHRDYYLDGTQIQIDMFKDRLEISSPGGFYRGEKLGKTYNLSGIISKRRNELIANILVACNVMEAAGTGFDKIIEEYKDANEAHKPYIYSSSDHFTLVLPDLTYDSGLEDANTPVLTFVPVPNGTELDEKVLSFCYLKAHKVSEIAEYLGISDSTYLRKQILGNLESHGYLEKDKLSRAMYYKTNPDMVELK